MHAFLAAMSTFLLAQAATTAPVGVPDPQVVPHALSHSSGAGFLLRNLVYLASAACFIVGLKRLGSPRTARHGNTIAACGMLAAVLATVSDPRVFHRGPMPLALIAAGIAIGTAIGATFALRVHMRGMPQMVALLNGFGGLAAALVGLGEYLHTSDPPPDLRISVAMSIVIGTITFTGSLVAWAKLEELKYKVLGQPITGSVRLPAHNALVFATPIVVLAVVAGLSIAAQQTPWIAILLMLLAGFYGLQFVLPIGGADMPVVIALLNSFSGLGAAATGMLLHNNALIIGGALVGASGFILTLEMCKAMNRSLLNVLAGGFGQTAAVVATGQKETRSVRQMDAEEAAMLLESAGQVVIVPGYGMAVAQAQHTVAEMAALLEKKGVKVKYGVHPVAGRMPGHMNVLLADANVPYEQLFDLDLNSEMEQTDVVMVIGANDVVNPAARDDKTSPIYGMPIFNVDKARTVMVLKRGMASGYAGVDNELFYLPNTVMVFGDAKGTVSSINHNLKAA